MTKDYQKEDHQRFFVVKPSKDFSELKTRQIIEETIKETDKNYIRRQKERQEQMAERVDVLTSYITHLATKNDSTPLEQYVGKQYLARLRGEDRIAKIKQAMAANQNYVLL